MPQIACPGCRKMFRPKKNGVYVLFMSENGHPTEIVHADLWSCPECGNEVIAGFGQGGIDYWKDAFQPAIKYATEKDLLYKIQ